MNKQEIMRQLEAAVQAYQGKDLDKAEAIFNQILAVSPKEPNALHFLGCICKDRGQLQQAVELIQASIREDDNNPLPFLNLGKILAISGQHDNAALIFQESLKRSRQIPEVWFCFGNSLREISKVEDARQAYRNALQLNPAHAGAASNLGALLSDEGELDEAEGLLASSIEQAPSDMNLRINYGKLLAEKDEHAAAIVQYQVALAMAPDSFELLFNYANSLKEDGEIVEAIASYRKAIELKPDFADSHYNLGNVLKDEGEIGEAIASYRKAIEVKPDFAIAYLNLGNVLKDEGEIGEAIVNYRKAIEVTPDFAIAYLNLGNALKEEGEIGEAIVNYRKAIEVKVGCALGYKYLATLLHEENELDEAVSLYASALEADDQSSNCRFHLYAAGVLNLSESLERLRFAFAELMHSPVNFLQTDLLFFRCICDFSEQLGMYLEFSADPFQDCAVVKHSLLYSLGFDDLLDTYALCRKSALPRWLSFENISSHLLLISDYLESLRVKDGTFTEEWKALKGYQLFLVSLRDEDLPSSDQLFSKLKDHDQKFWLSAERFQFPHFSAALSLQESLSRESSLPKTVKSDQSEFFRKEHLLDAQKFYMANEDPCFHGISELYRVHVLIANTINEIAGVKSVVDLGYYSCGVFTVGLNSGLKRYCIEPARHHAVWVEGSRIAEVLPDVPLRCVRSFEEYLSRLDAVFLEEPWSTAAVISFILQIFEYEQCVEILQKVKGFASYLVITDDILNEESDESILRLLSHGKRLNLCHNYQLLLSDAGWRIEKQWYFHGVRYASGIIVACTD